MNNDDDLDNNHDFDENAASSQNAKAFISIDARRRLEDRLEASKIRKQTQDYDFDLD